MRIQLFIRRSCSNRTHLTQSICKIHIFLIVLLSTLDDQPRVYVNDLYILHRLYSVPYDVLKDSCNANKCIIL